LTRARETKINEGPTDVTSKKKDKTLEKNKGRDMRGWSLRLLGGGGVG